MSVYALKMKIMRPIVRPSMPIHIESALLYSAINDGVPEADAWELLNRAIAYEGARNEGCYRASAIFFNTTTSYTRPATRHFNAHQYADDLASGLVDARAASKLNLQSGPVRSRLDFTPMIWATSAIAWMDCIDIEALEELVEHFQFIGKHAHLGCGQIADEDDGKILEPASDDSAWSRRILPAPCDGGLPIQATVRPPYWDRLAIQSAYMHPALTSTEHGSWC